MKKELWRRQELNRDSLYIFIEDFKPPNAIKLKIWVKAEYNKISMKIEVKWSCSICCKKKSYTTGKICEIDDSMFCKKKKYLDVKK